MKKMTYTLIDVNRVNRKTKDEMFNLFIKYFDCEEETFYLDLESKKALVLLENQDKDIVGFTSMDISVEEFRNKKIVILFSGNTIVDERYRDELYLITGFLEFAVRTQFKYPEYKIFWHLICEGYKTYRYLPLSFNRFYPHYKKESLQYEKELLDKVSLKRFNRHYDKNTDIIRIPGSELLKTDFAKTPQNKLNDKHIKFFTDKNPFYADGDKLSCIAEISYNNLKAIPKRIYKQLYALHNK